MVIFRYFYILFFFGLYSFGFGEEDTEELVRKVAYNYTKIQHMNGEMGQSIDELSEKVKNVINNIEKCNQLFAQYKNNIQQSDALIELMNYLGKEIRDLMGIYAQNIFKMESSQKFIASVTKDMQDCTLECQNGEGKVKKFYEAVEKLNKELSDFGKKRLLLDSDIEALRNKINTMNESVVSFVKGVSEGEIKINSFQAHCKNFLSDTKNINENIINLKKSLEEIEKRGRSIDALVTNLNNIRKVLIETEKTAIKTDEKLSELHEKSISLVEQDVRSLNQELQTIDSNIMKYNNNIESMAVKTKEFNKELSSLYPLFDGACICMEKRQPLMKEMLQVTDELTERINKLHGMLTNTENSLNTIFPRLQVMNQEFEKYTPFLKEIGFASEQLMAHNTTFLKIEDTMKAIQGAYEALDIVKREEMVKSLLSQCERLEHMTPQLEILIQKLEMVDSHKLEHFVNLLEKYDVTSQIKMDELIDHIDKKLVTEIMVEKKETDTNFLSHLLKMQEELRYTKYVTMTLFAVCFITPFLTSWMMRSSESKKK